jgi:hypothetical protein
MEWPGPTHEVGELTRPGLVPPVKTDPTGRHGSTPKQARGPRWRRTSRGWYVPAEVDGESVEQRIVEAAAVLPAFGAVTGWAALRWCGADWFSGLLGDRVAKVPVTLVTSSADIRSQAGITVSAEKLSPRDIVVVDGLRVTTPQRSVLFEMRYAASVEAAVIVADMAMYADLVSSAEVVTYAASLSSWTGIPQARKALPLMRENSWSPQETRMRLLWLLLAGLPEPLCNVPVFDTAGRHIGTPDLFEPTSGVVGEYEGAVHLDGRQRGVDVRREQAFRDVGLEYVAMVGADWRDQAGVVARLCSAYGRAVRRLAGPRSWTLEPPAWWVRTDTVDRRRELSAQERRRLLARRVG